MMEPRYGSETLSEPYNVVDRLERRCVSCPSTLPSCPVCDVGEKCSVAIQTCDACQSTKCIPDPSYTAPAVSTSASNAPNTAAIVGGVAGGVVVITLVVYLVWRFCIKTKRQQYEAEDWVEFQAEPTEAEKEFALRRDARMSTHTTRSIATTVLTRSSNVIKIAYIPGVINRSTPSTPDLLVPPVPPIPIATASAPNTLNFEDDHFFMPGDLRDSTYSAMTTMTAMTDYTSYAPRSSVASTIYGRNAIVAPVQPQTVTRAKAAVVSVRSNGASSGDVTPPVPQLDYNRYRIGPPSPTFSIGSTFLNSANPQLRPTSTRSAVLTSATAATQMKPTVVKVASSQKSRSTLSSDTEDFNELLFGRESSAITIIDDTPTLDQGPFRDPSRTFGPHDKDLLAAVIQEATRKAHSDVRAGLGLKRDNTPFGDEHALGD